MCFAEARKSKNCIFRSIFLSIVFVILLALPVNANSSVELYSEIDMLSGEYGSYVMRTGFTGEGEPYFLFVQNQHKATIGASRWISADVQPPHWIELDFGQQKTFNKIVLYFFEAETMAYFPSDYKIQYNAGSQVNPSWQDIIVVNSNTQRTPVYTFANVTAQQIRVYVTNPGPDNIARIYEIMVYDTQGKNIALSSEGTIASSSSYLSAYSGAEQAIDGYVVPYSNMWQSKNINEPHWITLDFGEPKPFDEIRLKFTDGRPVSDFKVQYKSGTNWVDIESVTGNTNPSRVFFLENPVTARELRIYITKGTSVPGDYRARINEIKVYNRASGDVNIARNVTVQSSSYVDGSEPFHAVSGNYIQEISCITAVNTKGEILLQVGTPNIKNGFVGYDLPVQIYDIDQDGQEEIIFVMNDKLKIMSIEGIVKKEVVLPIHADSIVIANFRGKDVPLDIMVKDRYSMSVVYDNNLNKLWSYNAPLIKSGHFPWPYDLNGDGRDEIMYGDYLLNYDGTMAWNSNIGGDDHSDSIRIADIDSTRSGSEIVVSHSDDGLYFFEADGTQYAHFDVGHAQKTVIGEFRPDIDGKEVFVSTQYVKDAANLALEEGVSVSTDSVYGNYVGDNAIDGNTKSEASRWVSDDSGKTHWMIVNLGEKKYINEIVLHFFKSPSNIEYFLKDYKLQYNAGSVQNPQWVDIVSVTGNRSQKIRHQFAPIYAQQIRLYITDPSTQGDNRARLYEIEIYEPRSPHLWAFKGDGTPLWTDGLMLAEHGGVAQMEASRWTLAGTGEEFLLIPKERALFDAFGKKVVQFPSSAPNRFGTSVDIVGDQREEILLWDIDRLHIYTNNAAAALGGKNLTREQNVTVTADSQYSSEFAANKAIDGDRTNSSSRWLSADTAQPHWLKVNFGRERVFDEVWLYFFETENNKYYMKDFKLQYNAGTVQNPVWTDIIAVNNNRKKVACYTFDPIRAQEFRLYVTNPDISGTSSIARLYEIEIYEAPNVKKNLAEEETVTVWADSQYDSAFTPDKAVDGDIRSFNSRWLSKNTAGAHWLIVDLGEEKTFDEIRLNMFRSPSGTQYYLKDYKIQYNSGTIENPTWVDIVNVTGNSLQYPVYNFNRITSQQIRLYITNPNTNGNDNIARLYEIEVLEVLPYSTGINNLCRQTGVTVSSSSAYSSEYGAENLVDGDDKSSDWKSAQVEGPHWILIDFGQVETFDQIIVHMNGTEFDEYTGTARDFKLQRNIGSLQSPIWEDIISVANNSERVWGCTFSPVSSQQVRLVILSANSGSDGMGTVINEIEIYESNHTSLPVQNDEISNETKRLYNVSMY